MIEVDLLKLDKECVRDVLLTLESLDKGVALTSDNYVEFPLLLSYDLETVSYTLKRLDEAGFVNVKFFPVLSGDDPFRATSLTWAGHQFLDNVRDNRVWEETKKAASKIAGVSLSVLSEVAASVLKRTLNLE